MSRFKPRLILLFASLLILINLGWISIPFLEKRPIHPAFLSVSLIVLTLEIVIPYFRRSSMLASTLFWVGLFLLLRMFVFFQPRLSLIELLIWVYLVVLIHSIARSIDSVDDAIRIAAESGEPIQAINLTEAEGLIRAELTRSRHYNRPFSVIAVQCPQFPNEETLMKVASEIRGHLVKNHVKTRLAKTLSRELRAMDIVLDDRERGNLLLLCPEVDAKNAEIMVSHLRDALERNYGFKAVMASASFPDASPTFDGLLELINTHLVNSQTVSGLSGEFAKSGSQASD